MIEVSGNKKKVSRNLLTLKILWIKIQLKPSTKGTFFQIKDSGFCSFPKNSKIFGKILLGSEII
jgi:hypothetical protein